jgi:prepilin-type N-terminal cleavage/methylation domain-containing protein
MKPDTHRDYLFAKDYRTGINQNAFTLLELVVVLAVLAGLAITLLPALAKTSPNSQALQCLNNHRQMANAWRMYADDCRDRIVYSSVDSPTHFNPLNQYAWTQSPMDFSPGNRANWDTNADLVLRPLWPYTGKNAAIYRCPSDRSYVVVGGTPMPRVRSISMNLYLGGFAGTDGGVPQVTPYRIFLKTTDLISPGPSTTFVFLDQRSDNINWGNFDVSMQGYPNFSSQYQFSGDYPGMFHNLSCSFSFADGHAGTKRWLDARTTPASAPGAATASPNNVDIAWLQDHATRPK